MATSAKLRGFAGLGALVSDIGVAKATGTLGSGVAPPPLPGARTQAADPYGFSASGRSSVGIAVVILAVIVLVVVILIANSGSQSTYRPNYNSPGAYTPPKEYVPTPTYKPTAPAYVPESTYKPPSYIPPSAPKYDTYVETKPPVGYGQTLDRNQIRYCQSQKIRVSAWQGALNRYSSTAINAFNAAVDDYNARCSNYRYYSGVLEGVRAEVEARRYTLETEGRALAAANP